ncbi:MAG TPA: class I SAM-dependent methyltransferase [Pseudonocardiaceae bacterium]|nr:class I SAM-dependent methyltransferase [Pseudonocardiaceae bacterium]
MSDIRRDLRRLVGQTVDRLAARYQPLLRAMVAAEVDRGVAAMRAETERLSHQLAEIEFRARRDVNAAGERDAVLTSARFAQQYMSTVATFPHPDETLKYALGLALPDGMALEFGVYSGHTLRIIRDARKGTEIYGFDSFQGLPEAWRPNIPAGAFHAPEVPEIDGAQLVVGWFDDSLPPFLAEHADPVTFLHVDCDLYSSTVTVLANAGPRLVPGSVIVFDEYWNYPGWQDHEHRAWQEYVAASGTRFEYVAYSSNNEQVVVRVTGTATADADSATERDGAAVAGN